MTTPTSQPRLEDLLDAQHYESGIEVCSGCENHCTVKVFRFQNGRSFYSGNNCEKVYSNEAEKKARGVNMFAEKYALLFRRKGVPTEQARMTIGIPRALGIYENYPFWHTLFTRCGIRVVLSAPSTDRLYATGIKSIMADNICFPAKLMHGHIMNLLDKKPDRIFYPYVVYEHKEDTGSGNSFNCPIVSGYSDVIKSAIDTDKNYNIPFDAPVITFKDVFDVMQDKALARAGRHKESYLLAEGLIDGKVVATHQVFPARRPTRLLLWADDEGVPLQADGSDMVVVVAAIADDQGNIKRLNNYEVRFEVEGPATLVANEETFTNPSPVRWGTAPVLVRSTLTPGDIKVRASVVWQGKHTPLPAELVIRSVAPAHVPISR